MKVIALSTLALLAAAPASAQLTNQDDCANSGVDVVGVGSYLFNTTAATTGTVGQATPPCYPPGIAKDIWFTYVAGVDGFAVISTCATVEVDTKIAVYLGSGVPCPPANTAIDCNDEGLCPGISVGMSTLEFPVVAGQSYIVQLGSWSAVLSNGPGIVDVIETEPGPLRLVAHYELDELAGTTAIDSSPNGNHGTFGGGYTLGEPGAATGSGTSVRFDGIDGHAVVPDGPSLNALRNDFSVIA